MFNVISLMRRYGNANQTCRSAFLLSKWRSFCHAASGNRIPFLLADIGEGIAEVEVMQWHVKKGDKVKQFQPIVDVQSDKATVEITSRYDGVIDELGCEAGETAKVGEPLCFIISEDESAKQIDVPEESGTEKRADVDDIEAQMSDVSDEEANGTRTKHVAPAVLKAKAAPTVRKLASDLKLDINKVAGSGADGRVLKEDILRAAAAATDAETVPSVMSPLSEMSSARMKVSPIVEPKKIPLRGLQRAMAKSMTKAAHIPTLALGEEVNVDKLVSLRKSLNTLFEQDEELDVGGIKLSYLPFFMKATSLALTRYPLLNASVNDSCDEVTLLASHNISVAMDTPHGLIVPNVKDVRGLSIVEIGRELKRLAELAKEGKIGKEDLSGGTFALSNIGAIGGTYSSPVLMYPQIAIGTLGKIRTGFKFDEDDDVPVPAEVLHVTWAADHRVLDGGTVARFSNFWKLLVEHPETMLAFLR